MKNKKNNIKKILIIGIIVLFIGASIVSGNNNYIVSQKINLSDEIQSSNNTPLDFEEITFLDVPTFQNGSDDDWDYWTNAPNMFANVTGNIGIGTSNPTNKLHIVGAASVPLVNIEQSGSSRGLRVNTTSACAIWVDHSGNHGLRVTNATGDGVHITQAGSDGIYVGYAEDWAGYFNGDGYFGGNVGIGTTVPDSPLEVAGIIHSSLGGFMFPDGTIQTSAGSGGGAGNLDQSYDFGGPGAGRTIYADSGAVNIAGPDGLTVNGFVGINTSTPDFELDVKGSVNANTYYVNDIFFNFQDMSVWKMYADLFGLYLKNMVTGDVYIVSMVKKSTQDTMNLDSTTIQLQKDIENLKAENEELKERIAALEMILEN